MDTIGFRDNFPELLGGTRELRKIFFYKTPVLQVSDYTNEIFREKVNAIQSNYTKEQAKEILELAKSYGTEQNLFFATTFERYQTQLQILEELKATIESDGFFVDKTYVKGETNLYSHPAVTQFNRTTDSANKTVVTLMKIITTLRDRQNSDEPDPLLSILAGRSK